MSKILVSGLINVEITCKIDKFPIEYQPIDYNFFGVNMAVAGVGYNVAKNLTALGDDIDITSMVGDDPASLLVRDETNKMNADRYITKSLSQTPSSVVLYDKSGTRRIYCDLKDIQEKEYNYDSINISEYDIACVCNINYSRPLLKAAKKAGVPIATDVHVLSDINDEYNKEFMENADILFMSNEAVKGQEKEFIEKLAEAFNNSIIVIGCGEKGAIMYVRDEDKVYEMPAAKPEKIVNTVGAGDCLFSTFVSMYAKKTMSPQKCLELAQKAAAHKIGTDGAAKGFMSSKELLTLI